MFTGIQREKGSIIISVELVILFPFFYLIFPIILLLLFTFHVGMYLEAIRAQNCNTSLKLRTTYVMLNIQISTCYIKSLLDFMDECSTYGQRYIVLLPTETMNLF